MTQYPLIKYHHELRPDGLIVRNAEQDRELGEGWAHSPAEALELFKKLSEPSEKEPDLPKTATKPKKIKGVA